ncbi:MAG: hypothetical protein ACLPH3_14715 [Terracidiphilus sp.]
MVTSGLAVTQPELEGLGIQLRYVGVIAYNLALVVLGLCAAFAKHLPFRVMHKASITAGFGFAALIELYRIPFVLYRPTDLAVLPVLAVI